MSYLPFESAAIGIVSISDRASGGVYEDKGLPALKEWLTAALHNPVTFVERLIPDEQAQIEATLIELAAQCCLVLTTGGTGPAPRCDPGSDPGRGRQGVAWLWRGHPPRCR